MGFVQSLVTILSLINPAICAAMFSGIEAGRPRQRRLRDALIASLVVLGILLISALAGVRLLDAFGISLPAFKVAGGMVLVWMGFTMIRGRPPGASGSAARGGGASLSSLILFAASPGTITGVITLAVHHSGRAFPLPTLGGIVVAVLLTGGVLAALALREHPTGNGSGGQRATASFMGLIVLAMGVQFALSGLRAFFAAGA